MKDLIYYIERLIESTKNNKIPWFKLRENIFVWQTETSENVRTNIILQKRGGSLDNSILFRLYEVENKRTLLDIDTKTTNEKTKKAISDLFEVIENSKVNYELNVLDDLLRNI